jgi:hypothetical protein
LRGRRGARVRRVWSVWLGVLPEVGDDHRAPTWQRLQEEEVEWAATGCFWAA